MIHRILEFRDTTAHDIMIPLIEVVAIEAKANVEEVSKLISLRGLSRIPVYEDRIDNIVGLVSSSTLVKEEMSLDTKSKELMRDVLYIPETKRVREALSEFRERGEYFAVVVDEYGGAIGILTVEDIMEEVFGSIEDEHDRSKRR